MWLDTFNEYSDTHITSHTTHYKMHLYSTYFGVHNFCSVYIEVPAFSNYKSQFTTNTWITVNYWLEAHMKYTNWKCEIVFLNVLCCDDTHQTYTTHTMTINHNTYHEHSSMWTLVFEKCHFWYVGHLWEHYGYQSTHTYVTDVWLDLLPCWPPCPLKIPVLPVEQSGCSFNMSFGFVLLFAVIWHILLSL